jgi:hypothetical protein
MMYAIEVASCGIICIPGFIKFSTVVQAILRLYLRNLRDRNVDITDGRVLWYTPRRRLHAPLYSYQVACRLEQASQQYWGFASAIRMDVMLVLPMGGIYGLIRWDGLRCHDIWVHIQFNKNWFWHLKVVSGNAHRDTQRAMWSHKPTFIIFKIRKGI